MKKRILLGSLMILALLVIFSFDFYIWKTNSFSPWLRSGRLIAIITTLISIISTLELNKIARKLGIEPHTYILIPMIIITILGTTYTLAPHHTNSLLIGVILIFIAQLLRFDTIRSAENITWSTFTLIYLGLLPSYWVLIRTSFGPLSLITLIAIVKSADIGAYFIGSIFGTYKLVPWLSPKKTIEGLIGAILTGGLISLAFSTILNYPTDNPLTAFILGTCFALIGQFGDLIESSIKRSANVKDSASIIPEFGGILDLIDSLLPAGFIWYIVIQYIY